MPIWMIGERYMDVDYPDHDPLSENDVNVEYGYFITLQAALAKVSALSAQSKSNYETYRLELERSNKIRLQKYAEEIENYKILKDMGRPAPTPIAPYIEKVRPYEQWSSMIWDAVDIHEGTIP